MCQIGSRCYIFKEYRPGNNQIMILQRNCYFCGETLIIGYIFVVVKSMCILSLRLYTLQMVQGHVTFAFKRQEFSLISQI